nr:MAG TPA: hypothetical protein [Caudoviricetes sp.]
MKNEAAFSFQVFRSDTRNQNLITRQLVFLTDCLFICPEYGA